MFDRHGAFIRSIGEGIVQLPFALAACANGRIYVTCPFQKQVFLFDKTGALSLLESSAPSSPSPETKWAWHVVVARVHLGGNRA
jgi:hypothetical protein